MSIRSLNLIIIQVLIALILLHSCREKDYSRLIYSSEDSLKIELKELLADSTIHWKDTYKNAEVNEVLNGKLSLHYLNKPGESLEFYAESNDSIFCRISSIGSGHIYKVEGNYLFKTQSNLVDSHNYDVLFAIQPSFIDSLLISTL